MMKIATYTNHIFSTTFRRHARIKYLLVPILISSALLLSACSPSANKLLAQGEAAYKTQNYHIAFNNILAAAKKGNIQAQYTLGYMYYYGIGTPRNMQHAIAWLDYAAQHGDPRAIQAIQLLQK